MNGHQPRDRQQLTALTFRGLELLLPSSSMKPTNVAVQSSTLTSSSSQGGAQVEGEGDNTAAGIVGLPSPARDLLFDLLAYLSPTARATGERRLDLMSGGAGEVAAAVDSDAAGVSTTATAVSSATTGEQVPLTAALTALSTAALTPDDSNTTSTTVAGPLSPRAIDQETVDRVLALKRSVLLQGQARDLPRPCAATSTDTNTSVVLGPATADIPGYRFERVLGSGGFGQVRLATHVLTGCHVCVHGGAFHVGYRML